MSTPNPFTAAGSTDPTIDKPSFVAYEVDGGLDLVTSLTHVQPGAMVMCQNYEVARQRGARRIDGYELFDGGTSPSFTELQNAVIEIQFTLSGSSHVADFAAGNLLTQALYDASGNVIGSITSQSIYNASTYAGGVTTVNVYVVNLRDWPYGGNPPTYYPFNYPANYSVSGGSSISTFLPAGTSLAIYTPTSANITYTRALLPSNTAVLAAVTAFFNIINPTIQGVPGQGNVNGLFYLKDTLYATRDMLALTFTAGARQPSIQDVLYQGTDTAHETFSAVLAKIKITSGDWTTGDAAGTFMVYNAIGSRSGGVALKNATVPGSNVATNSNNYTASTAAALYKATGQRGTTVPTLSWQFCDLGYTVPFVTGGVEFQDMNLALSNLAASQLTQSTSWHNPTTVVGGLHGWGAVVGTFAANLAGSSPTNYDVYSTALAVAPTNPSGTFSVTGFGFTATDIPVGGTITGFELNINREYFLHGTLGVQSITDNAINLIGVNDNTNHPFGNANTPWTASYVNATYGGQQSLFGYTTLTQATISQPAFGVSYSIVDTPPGGGYSNTNYLEARINNLQLRIWYLPQTNAVYFYNYGAVTPTAVKANIVQHYVTTGSSGAGNAAGTLYFQFVQADGTIGGQPSRPITSGEKIFIYPSAGGTPTPGTDILIAYTGAIPAMNVMDWSSLIAAPPLQDGTFAPAAKYQHITKNFYASSGFDAIYGVSGAGPAFYYDGINFSRILTGLTGVLESPRHITEHQGHIVLGYYSGLVEWSNTDNVLTFDPTLGNKDAAGLGFGERINGLASLNGDSLAVETRGQVKMIQGQFDGPTPAYVSIISPTSGCIEYSMQPMENWMYADFRGITTIGATQKYGDFEIGHLSALVAPFLVPRLQLSSQFEGGNMGVINSVLVRNKNQYRLFFGDGMVLTVTFLVDGEPPQFTTQRYFNSNPEAPVPLTWDVLCVGTESTGRDHIYGATTDGLGMVFELDRGTSFNGAPIPAFVMVAGNDLQSPYDRKMFYDVGIHGVAQDYATFTMSRSPNYTVPTSTVTIPMTFGSLAAVPNGEVLGYVSFNTLQMEGRSINLLFNSSVNNQFPHAIQSIVLSAKALEDKRT